MTVVRVLVVEDEVNLAKAIKRGLDAEGFTTDLAFDGQDGLRRVQEGNYDAVVLDIMLPKLNGFRVCAALRAAEDWTPVLMLTAKDGELDEAEALDTGADDFLSKPFSYVVLVARLHALIRRGGARRGPVLQAGDLRLDPSQHRVWRGDAEIELTARQFSLLEYLMSRAGEVVSKTEILDDVWDDPYAGDANTVEVHIGHLRKRIDVPFGRSAIQTVRLVGYRLDLDGG